MRHSIIDEEFNFPECSKEKRYLARFTSMHIVLLRAYVASSRFIELVAFLYNRLQSYLSCPEIDVNLQVKLRYRLDSNPLLPIFEFQNCKLSMPICNQCMSRNLFSSGYWDQSNI